MNNAYGHWKTTMHGLQARLDRLRAAVPPHNDWGDEAERAAMADAIAAHVARREIPASTLRTLRMTAGDFADMVRRIEASC